jgi:hypothetical protein
MMLRYSNWAIVFGCVVVGGSLVALSQQPQALNANNSAEVSVLMQAKLGSSQKVVEGLMSSDFGMIRKGGEDLQKICDSNQWRRGDDQVVGHYRSELRRAANKLVEQAKAENLDGAAYTYMQTMTTCISCHQYTRNVLRVAHSKPSVIPIPVTEEEMPPRNFRSVYR